MLNGALRMHQRVKNVVLFQNSNKISLLNPRVLQIIAKTLSME